MEQKQTINEHIYNWLQKGCKKCINQISLNVSNVLIDQMYQRIRKYWKEKASTDVNGSKCI